MRERSRRRAQSTPPPKPAPRTPVCTPIPRPRILACAAARAAAISPAVRSLAAPECAESVEGCAAQPSTPPSSPFPVHALQCLARKSSLRNAPLRAEAPSVESCSENLGLPDLSARGSGPPAPWARIGALAQDGSSNPRCRVLGGEMRVWGKLQACGLVSGALSQRGRGAESVGGVRGEGGQCEGSAWRGTLTRRWRSSYCTASKACEGA